MCEKERKTAIEEKGVDFQQGKDKISKKTTEKKIIKISKRKVNIEERVCVRKRKKEKQL